MRVVATFLLVCALGLVSCAKGPEIREIQLSGDASVKDSNPALAGAVIDYQVILVMNGDLEGCEKGSGAKQATAFRKLQLGDDQSFTTTLEPRQMAGIPLPDCRISNVRLAEIQSLRIRAILEDSGGNLISDRRYDGDELEEQGRIQNGVLTLRSSLVFDEISPPSAEGGLPDLMINRAALESSVGLSRETIQADSCAANEGCVTGSGMRDLLRFDTEVMNVGGSDLFFGKPVEPLFEYDACHQHSHLGGFVRYELFKNDELMLEGKKEGFCIMDWMRSSGDETPVYDCDYQGLSAGWSDLYDRSLDCQWLDVTGLPSGDYVLRVTVNPEGRYEEAETSNNSAEIEVTL